MTCIDRITTRATLGLAFALASFLATAQGAAQGTPAAARSPLPTGRTSYRTLAETNAELEKLAAANPGRVTRFELPNKSLLGTAIYGLEITHKVKSHDGKPVFLMTGLHHAREWPTVELTMEFINDVLNSDGKDPKITALLDKVRVIAVPVVNPDGYEMSRSLIHEQQRKNCRIEMGKIPTREQCADSKNTNGGVDLNRNYGPFWGGGGATIGVSGGSSRGEMPYSEPEIRNMRDLMASHQVVVALSNHTPDAKVLRVPSAAEEPEPADLAPYDSLAQALGADLKWPAGPWPTIYYVASGTMEENAYYSAGTFAFTFENTPGQRSFHPAYSFVIDQYFGTGAYPGSSARAGFMRLYEAAADASKHSVLRVKAPTGATLTIEKKFTMESSPVIQADSSRNAPLTFSMALTSSTVVPKGGSIEWHVNPSMRPSQHAKEFISESWTLTCSKNGKSQSVNITVSRGAIASANLSKCTGGAAAVKNDLSTTKTMTTKASGTFDVTLAPLKANEDGDVLMGRMSIDKIFHGDLEGTSKGQMLTGGDYTKGSAGYVAIERVIGTLNGKDGAFILQHSATMHAGTQSMSITIVPGSGTGALTGISGTFEIIIEGKKHSYVLTYSFPNAS
jgi:carboxypeptidase T